MYALAVMIGFCGVVAIALAVLPFVGRDESREVPA
jgi:hypothetical protein